jgi:predicted nucleic acid-binding protein
MLQAHAGGEVLFTSALNVEEVYRGLLASEEGVARRLFDGLRIVALGRSEAEQAGRWRREHAGRGRTLSQGDCLVAAAALSIGARLATGNPKDFPMPELEVEVWPVGA